MKILYVVTSAELGGAQKSALLLAKYFHGSIAAGTEKQDLFLEAKQAGVPTFGLKNLKREVSPIHDFIAIFELFSLIKKLRPDLVHLNSSKAGFIGSIAGKLAGTKVIYSARGFVFNEPHSWFVKSLLIGMEKFASVLRDQIITVSAADEISAKKYNLISPKKIITIHNAIPAIQFVGKDEALKTLNLPSDKIIIGTIANFYPTKGLDILIHAISQIDKKLLGTCLFVVIGAGPLEQTLKSLVQKLELNNHIKFAGQIKNAGSLLKAFDIFVLPSRKEGFPLTLLEALQGSLPIIATDVGGNAELLGQAGILVPSNSPAELAKAITLLIENKSQQSQLASQALKRAESFTLKKLFHQTQEVYEKILAQ